MLARSIQSVHIDHRGTQGMGQLSITPRMKYVLHGRVANCICKPNAPTARATSKGPEALSLVLSLHPRSPVAWGLQY